MPHSDTGHLNIVLVTDVFPPKSGGSGWSTFYLGKALADKGHTVKVLRPRYDLPTRKPALRRTEFGGLPVEEIVSPAAPGWANKTGLGRAWQERTTAHHLARRAAQLVLHGEADILHGQHKVSAMAVSRASVKAHSQGATVASVATVRDYWPLCPVSTRLFTRQDGSTFECRECHRLGKYMASVQAEKRGGVLSRLLSLARWFGTRSAAGELARCDAVIAVSRYVRDELALSGRIPGNRLYNIPNLIDLPSVDCALAGAWPLHDISLEEPFALFVGKFDVNKGAIMLPEAVQHSGVKLPVVLLGDGLLQEGIEQDARSLGLDFRFYSWLDNDAVLRVMYSARVLLFPSAWQEPLSRVLLEGCAAGAAIVALDTGGTQDVITHGVSGWLAQDMDGFVAGIKAVVEDDTLNSALRAGAMAKSERVFAAPRVAAEVEGLYRALLDAQRERAR